MYVVIDGFGCKGGCVNESISMGSEGCRRLTKTREGGRCRVVNRRGLPVNRYRQDREGKDDDDVPRPGEEERERVRDS